MLYLQMHRMQVTFLMLVLSGCSHSDKTAVDFSTADEFAGLPLYDVLDWSSYIGYVQTAEDDGLTILVTRDRKVRRKLVGFAEDNGDFEEALAVCERWEPGVRALIFEHRSTGRIDVWCRSKGGRKTLNLNELLASKRGLTAADVESLEMTPWVKRILVADGRDVWPL